MPLDHLNGFGACLLIKGDLRLKGASADVDFLRSHVAVISYNTLKEEMKGGTTSLAEKLVQEGAFTEDAAISMGVIKKQEEEQRSNIFAEGSPISIFSGSDIASLGVDDFRGSDLEIANQILEW